MEPTEISGEGPEPQSAVEPRRRSKLRWLAWIFAAVAALAVIAIASTYLFFANVYMPLAVTGYGPDSGPGSLYLRTANGEFGAHPTLVYCSTSNGRFSVFLALINTGSFPVTILGGDPGPGGPVTDHTNVNGFTLANLAYFRSQPGNGMSPATDPRTASTIGPTILEPWQELDLWARFQMGSMALDGQSRRWIDRIWIRYSTFGIARTAEVPLILEIGATGDCGH